LSNDLEWRRSIANVLEANAIEFAFASTIEQCKDIVAHNRVGLIFWDSRSGEKTYLGLIRSVWSVDRSVKIVAICRTDEWGRYVETAQSGAFGVIPIPCQPTDVEWVIRRAVRAERAARKTLAENTSKIRSPQEPSIILPRRSTVFC